MDRHALLLFTNVFPYDKGEEFLENEIGDLAAAFDQVVVVATQTKPGAVQTRVLPANAVALRAGGPRPTGSAAARTVARGLVAFGQRRFQQLSREPRRAAQDAMFEGRALRTAVEAMPQLEALGLDQFSDITICSYWFHITARAAVQVADRIRAKHPKVRITRLVSRAHRYDLYNEVSPMGYIPMRPQLLERFDAVHPVSDDGTSYLQQHHPQHAGKISTRRLGTPDPGELVQASRQPFHVVSCSFVIPVKRVDRFATLLKMVLDEGVDVHWTHYGSGDDLDAVRQSSQALLGADRVDMPGYVKNVELADRYRAQHPSVFMNLSKSEGVPVSIMEAIALGLPVVATDVGGVREIVHDGENGALLGEDFTDRQAADALLALARMSDEEYAATCAASRRIWEENYDMTKVFPAWAKELRG